MDSSSRDKHSGSHSEKKIFAPHIKYQPLIICFLRSGYLTGYIEADNK